MWKYILKRVLLMVPQLLVVSIAVFLINDKLPGNPALQEAMKLPNVTAAQMEALEAKYHINDPIHIQYVEWIKGAVQGDFGNSYKFFLPVTELISERLVNTIYLGVFTFIVIFLVGIPLGVTAGKNKGSMIDRIIVGYNYVTLAVPSFVIGILMLFFFGYKLGWFPTGGSISPEAYASGNYIQQLLSRLYHIALPGLTSGLLGTAIIIQYLRNEIIDVQLSDFVKTARAKGASQRRLYNVHILRNAFLPVASVLGFYLAAIMAGNIFIETVYSYPGIGQLFISSITLRDYPVVTGVAMFSATLALIGSLLSDIILVSVDPRLRIK